MEAPDPGEVAKEAPVGWYEHEGEQRYWEGDRWGKRWSDPNAPGWHRKDGALRYFDGSTWTEHIAPPPSFTTSGIAGAVFIGVLAALFVVWLGAQFVPEHVYLPMKFVVNR